MNVSPEMWRIAGNKCCVIKRASFPIIVGKFFYQSSGRKSFTFPQIFNQKVIFKTQHNCLIVTNNSSKVL